MGWERQEHDNKMIRREDLRPSDCHGVGSSRLADLNSGTTKSVDYHIIISCRNYITQPGGMIKQDWMEWRMMIIPVAGEVP